MLSKSIRRSIDVARRARSTVLPPGNGNGTTNKLEVSCSLSRKRNVTSAARPLIGVSSDPTVDPTPTTAATVNKQHSHSHMMYSSPSSSQLKVHNNIGSNLLSNSNNLAAATSTFTATVKNSNVSDNANPNLKMNNALNEISAMMKEFLLDDMIMVDKTHPTYSQNMNMSMNKNINSNADADGNASQEFYTTMHNVLTRTNTPIERYNRIMNISVSASSSSATDLSALNTTTTTQGRNHYNYNYNHSYNNNQSKNMMINARQFSTTDSSKSDQTKDDKSSSTTSSSASLLTETKTPSTANNPTPPKTLAKKFADKSIQEKTQAMLKTMITTISSFLQKIPGVLYFYITHPKEFKEKLFELKEMAKKEAHHYYMGSKLLMADLKTARQMLGRLLQGSPLTRRERKQFIRTVTDVFRLVPMSIFVLIPFMELALPIALKIFPNMLPSTFQDSLKAEENMKRELKSRIAMTEFFQETLQDLVKGQRKKAANKKEKIKADDGPSKELESTESREETAASFLEFIEKARTGEFLPPEVIIRYSSFFRDELTLDNMPRMQLINMCKYMSIPPYGNDHFLRFQLRHKIRVLQEDDQRILWEGIDSLTKMELREACQERGMRSTGMSKDAYKRSLQQWIDLSVNRNVPISLLIMSRTFFLREEMTSRASVDTDGSKSVAGLADAISGLDREVVNEVILESVTPEDKKRDPELMKLKLEVLQHQNELIKEEKEQREAQEAKKAELALEKQETQKEEESVEQIAIEDNEVKIDDLKSKLDKNDIPEETVGISPVGTRTTDTQEELKLGKTSDAEIELKDEVFDQKEEEEEENTLSSDEIDAISQLVSPDPVSAERQKLEKIKASMQEEESTAAGESEEKEMKELGVDDIPAAEIGVTGKEAPIESFADEQDKKAAEQIIAMEEASRIEADSSTTISMEGGTESDSKEIPVSSQSESDEEDDYTDEKLDKAIAGLKSKVESMVGNIEVQLSNVEEKIGDKLHFLDKDMDGILSREEMALCLQKVLKRPLTIHEAMAIAADMDENEDGYFSLDELSKWLETNKIVKLVEEGRDAEVDEIIERQANVMKDEQQKE